MPTLVQNTDDSNNADNSEIFDTVTSMSDNDPEAETETTTTPSGQFIPMSLASMSHCFSKIKEILILIYLHTELE